MPTERALGVPWDIQSDTSLSKIKPKELPDTRRKDTSLPASMFDSVGVLVQSENISFNSMETWQRLE